MTEPQLTDRDGLYRDVADLGVDLGIRRFAYALSALGVVAESRPLPAPKRGRTKHYYRETAWAIVALHYATGGDFERLSNVLEPYRQEWDVIQEGDHRYWSVHIPGWADREFGALLLLLAGPEYGLSPQLAVDLANRPKALSITSFGSEFMDTVIDAVLEANANWIQRWLRKERDADMARKRETMAAAFVYSAGHSFDLDGQIARAIEDGSIIAGPIGSDDTTATSTSAG